MNGKFTAGHFREEVLKSLWNGATLIKTGSKWFWWISAKTWASDGVNY